MLSLPESPDTPLFAIVSRLADHKGLDLVALAADDILEGDVQLIVLGKGEYYYENFFYHLAQRYPNKVSALLVYNKDLSKKVYAGADMFLMPSKTEPCGLSQMIASRYGAVRSCGKPAGCTIPSATAAGRRGATASPSRLTARGNCSAPSAVRKRCTPNSPSSGARCGTPR